MNADLVKIINDVEGASIGFGESGDPVKVEVGESMARLITGLRRLRSVAIAAGMPETIVDKIALDAL